MRVIGRGPSAKALRRWGVGRRGVVNWSGRVKYDEDCNLNAGTETDKLNQLIKLRDADVPTVSFCTSLPPIAAVPPAPPWFPRTALHREGRDFDRPTVPDFWTEPTNSQSEFRVHVFRKPGGRLYSPKDFNVVRIGWKVAEIPCDQEFPIRTRRFGWTLKYYATPDNCKHSRLKTIAKWAISVLGWDFGAVDVLRKPDGKFVVLECNSCPGLRDEITFNTYTQHIGALLEG